jgi:DNA-binding MarR family transcriptional regulator
MTISNPNQPAPLPKVKREHLTEGMSPVSHISYQITIAANLMAFGSSTRNFKEFGLNVGEWRIIGLLGQMGPVTASQIVELLTQDKASISRSITALDSRQLVVKMPNPKHKRSPYIWMTHAGLNLYRSIVPVFTEQAEKFCAGLTREEQITFCALLDKLTHHTGEVRRKEGL